MNEEQAKAILQEYDERKQAALTAVLAKRKAALQIAIDNLVRDMGNLPDTAQDVIAVYSEVVARLCAELNGIK